MRGPKCRLNQRQLLTSQDSHMDNHHGPGPQQCEKQFFQDLWLGNMDTNLLKTVSQVSKDLLHKANQPTHEPNY